MKKYFILSTALFLTGCPDSGGSIEDPLWDSPATACIEEYTAAMFAAGADAGDNFSETCDNALVSMSEEGSEEWMSLHITVWDTEGSIPACRGNDGTSEIHRSTLLRDREIMRIRCHAEGPNEERCDGHDPEACSWN